MQLSKKSASGTWNYNVKIIRQVRVWHVQRIEGRPGWRGRKGWDEAGRSTGTRSCWAIISKLQPTCLCKHFVNQIIMEHSLFFFSLYCFPTKLNGCNRNCPFQKYFANPWRVSVLFSWTFCTDGNVLCAVQIVASSIMRLFINWNMASVMEELNF